MNDFRFILAFRIVRYAWLIFQGVAIFLDTIYVFDGVGVLPLYSYNSGVMYILRDQISLVCGQLGARGSGAAALVGGMAVRGDGGRRAAGLGHGR